MMNVRRSINILLISIFFIYASISCPSFGLFNGVEFGVFVYKVDLCLLVDNFGGMCYSGRVGSLKYFSQSRVSCRVRIHFSCLLTLLELGCPYWALWLTHG